MRFAVLRLRAVRECGGATWDVGLDSVPNLPCPQPKRCFVYVYLACLINWADQTPIKG